MAESNPCGQCCFMGSLSSKCEFEFWGKYLNPRTSSRNRTPYKSRIPDGCPRGIPRNANWKESQRKYRQKCRVRPLSEFELQVLDALRSHPSNFGLKHQHVFDLLNGRRPRRRSPKYININTTKRIFSALQALRVRGFVRAERGRWFPLEAREVGESNQLRAARGA